ncbi:MAG: hypothetical protein GY884_19950 [Proteobacteria bacterium]|nr:hypothetical protein [Pseudomonadota bacterium]
MRLLALLACAPGGIEAPGVDPIVDTFVDADGDGWGHALDCDDTDSAIHPEALEIYDAVDNDCDGRVDEGSDGMPLWYIDADGDGY